MAFFPAFGAALGALGQATEGTFEKMQAMRQARQQAQLTEGQIAAMPWHQRLLQSQVGGAEAAAKQASEQRGIYKGMQEVLGDPTLSAEDRVRKLAGLAAGIPKVAEKAGEAATKSMVGGAVPYSKGGALNAATALAQKEGKNFSLLPPPEQAAYYERGKAKYDKEAAASRVASAGAVGTIGKAEKSLETYHGMLAQLQDAEDLIRRMREGIAELKSRPDGSRLMKTSLNYVVGLLGVNHPLVATLTKFQTYDAQFAVFARAFEKLGVRIPVQEAQWARSFHPQPGEPFEAMETRVAEAEKVLGTMRASSRQRVNDLLDDYRGVLRNIGAPEALGGVGPGQRFRVVDEDEEE